MRVKEWTTFGTTMLTLVGTLNVSQGLLVGFAGSRVGFDRNDVAFTSAGTWAAATVTLGVLLAITGFALRARKPSAKLAAVSIVALHAISQLAMLRAYAAWSLLMVTLDVIILFILTVPRSRAAAASPDDSTEPAQRPAPVAKLALRRNNRNDAYRPRHKAGRPLVRHSAEHSDIIFVDLMPDPDPAAVVFEETIEAELVFDSPTTWVKAIGQATVPVPLTEPTEEARVPIQRASLESLDPLIDPLPVVLAEEAAIAAATVDEDPEELQAIGARPYVNR